MAALILMGLVAAPSLPKVLAVVMTTTPLMKLPITWRNTAPSKVGSVPVGVWLTVGAAHPRSRRLPGRNGGGARRVRRL